MKVKMTKPNPEAVEALKQVRESFQRFPEAGNFFICNRLEDLAYNCPAYHPVVKMLQQVIQDRLAPHHTYGYWLHDNHYDMWLQMDTNEKKAEARVQWLNALIKEFGGADES